MNKYLIPLIITTSIGIYYFFKNRKNNNIKIIESKETNTDSNKERISKDIIKLKTIVESNELKQIKDKSKYQIVVYKKPDGWEIVD